MRQQGRPVMPTGSIERQQAEQELARFIRDQVGGQDAVLAVAEDPRQLIWTARSDGWIDYCNQRCLDYLGLALGQVRGWDWLAVLHPSDRPLCLDRWKASLAAGQGYEIEYRIRGADGSHRWFLGRASPVRDRGGRIVKWFGTSTDIGDQRRAGGRTAGLMGRRQRRIAEQQTLLAVLPVGAPIGEDATWDRVRFNRHYLQRHGL